MDQIVDTQTVSCVAKLLVGPPSTEALTAAKGLGGKTQTGHGYRRQSSRGFEDDRVM